MALVFDVEKTRTLVSFLLLPLWQELINWTNVPSIIANYVNSTAAPSGTTYPTNLTGDNRFIPGGFGGHWRNPVAFSSPVLWQGNDRDGGINNPGSSGFRLPT